MRASDKNLIKSTRKKMTPEKKKFRFSKKGGKKKRVSTRNYTYSQKKYCKKTNFIFFEFQFIFLKNIISETSDLGLQRQFWEIF